MVPDPGKTNSRSRRLLVSIFLNALITLAEMAGGILSNSLALVSDSVHNLGDTMALGFAWIADRIGKREADLRRTFGYRRLEIISAFINASVLTAVSIYLVYTAVLRIIEPSPIRSGLMLIVAVSGLAVNLISMLVLRHDSGTSLNIRAAYLHLLGDTLSSVAVIAGALLIRYSGWIWIDPLLTIIISLVITRQAYRILTQSVNILMQSTPSGIDLEKIKELLENHPMVKNVHHIHCWQMQDRDILFEAHVETSADMKLSESGVLSKELEDLLRNRFLITHATLQIEYDTCDDKGMIRQAGHV